MAEAQLVAAAAGAWLVRAAVGVLPRLPCHHLGGRTALLQQTGHVPQGRLHVRKEQAVSGAQVVRILACVGRADETVLRATTVAPRAYRACQARCGQGTALVLHERALPAAKDERAQRRLVDIAQTVAGLDVVVTAIQVAVVFQRRPVTAFGRMHAQAVSAEARFQRHVEIAHEHAPDVVAHPLLEHIDKKAPVLRGPDRALRDEIARLRVQRPLATGGRRTPALVGQFDGLRRGPFDDRDELQPFSLQLVAQKSVDRAAMVLVRRVDRAQDVACDAVAAL